ncbi:unnamed protein product, partial [Musa acuminata subsp. burmannicoides]
LRRSTTNTDGLDRRFRRGNPNPRLLSPGSPALKRLDERVLQMETKIRGRAASEVGGTVS